MTTPDTEARLSHQLDLAEVRLHLESLNAATEELAPAIRRAQQSLLGHLESQDVDLESLWLAIEPELGLTSQQHEAVRLLREELSEQARPVSFAAAGGFMLFTSFAGGDADIDVSDGTPQDSGPVAMQSVEYDPDLDTSRYPASAGLAPELAEVVATHPALADALGDLLHDVDAGGEHAEFLGDDDVSSPSTGDDWTPPGALLDDLTGPGGFDDPGVASPEPAQPSDGPQVPSASGFDSGGDEAGTEADSPAAGGKTALSSDGSGESASDGSGESASDGSDESASDGSDESASDGSDESADARDDDSGEPSAKGQRGNASEHASAVAGTTPGEGVAAAAQAGGADGSAPGGDISELAGGGDAADDSDDGDDVVPAADAEPDAEPGAEPDAEPDAEPGNSNNDAGNVAPDSGDSDDGDGESAPPAAENKPDAGGNDRRDDDAGGGIDHSGGRGARPSGNGQ